MNTIEGIAPLEEYLVGLRADVIGEHDPAGLTVERLLQSVERHISLESDALDQYEHLATASDDAVIALVMRLILDDEARHHALLMRIATTLRECLNWTQSPNAPPRTTGGEATVNAAGMATTARTLIEEEHAGARAMRRLASQERGLDGGLDSLLLEMMAMDSDKHARRLSNRCVRRLRRAVSPRSRPARVT
jgi:hypothetical protein